MASSVVSKFLTNARSAIKKLISGIPGALCLVVALSFNCAWGAEQPANRTLKAGVFNFQGYHSKDADGSLYGYGIDLLNLISAYSRLNFDLTGYDRSWADMLEMLKNGEIDLVSSARRTPEREEVFAYSLPVGRNHTVLSKNIYNTRIHAGDYSTYNGIKIGAITGSSQNAHLENFAKERGFTYTLVEFDSPQELSDALSDGRVDAILSSNLRKADNEIVLNVLRSDNFYIIVRKEDQDLIRELNYAIQQMDLNEGDWLNALYYAHYGPDEPRVREFSQREKNYIKDVKKSGKKIRALTKADNPPYSFLENGEIRGIIPDYFTKAMQIADLPFELVAPQNQEDYASKIQTGEIDIVLDNIEPGSAYENNPGSGLATEPYLSSGLAYVMPINFRGEPRTVAISDVPDIKLKPELLKNVDIRRYPSPEAAIEAVERGEVDGTYVLPLTAQVYLNRSPGSRLFYTILDDDGAAFKLLLPSQSDHELLTILKKAIKRLPSATLTQLGTNYTSVDASEMSLVQYLNANPEIMMGGGIVIVLGSSLLFFMWMRGRWNRRLLATTEHANHELAGQLAIVEALSRDYSNVLVINSSTGMANIVKISDVNTGDEQEEGEDRVYANLLDSYIREKVHPKDRKYVANALSLSNISKQLALKDEFSGTYRIIDREKVHYFQFTFVRPHGMGGENESLILAGLRNIDDVIRREREQKKALAEALEQSRYANAAKTTFLNNMSHDIRTPMNAIIGFTALASANSENATLVRRYLGKIMTSGNHLLSLINDVLDMSRIESGKVIIEEQPVSLPEMLRDLRTIAQADVKARNLDFRIEAFNIINEQILCDKLRLNQVLLNILSNAMKYTSPGGKVRLRVTQTESGQTGKGSYEFRISDSGIGMSKEFLKHVFEPFERERTSTISGIQGTGLGLAITSKIVGMMGGTIDVSSEVGKGSEFAVKFCFNLPENAGLRQLPDSFADLQALVVDSDVESWENIQTMLSSAGISSDWAPLGTEAIERAKNRSYGLYLIDIRLADMDGIELTRQLRKLIGQGAQIILLSDNDWTELENAAKEAGASAFCSQPVFLSELADVLTGVAKKAVDVKLPSKESFAGKSILLAEDNEMNQEIAQMILENAGFKIDIVENGQEAVDRIQNMPADAYDLILMDVQMPIMNGYAATRAIRNLEDTVKSRIPIIAMTANAFDEDREEAMNAGMNGHVPKPIDIKKLMGTLTEVLGKE